VVIWHEEIIGRDDEDGSETHNVMPKLEEKVDAHAAGRITGVVATTPANSNS
jgi:hypothetical protein